MKFLQVLLILFVGLVFETNAQLCGQYGTTLKVSDEAGNPMPNPKFEITPLQGKNELLGKTFVRDDYYPPPSYMISFPEGYQIRGKYRVVVSAKGYTTAQKELEFPHCSRIKYEVVLKPQRTESVSFFLELVQISGELWTGKKRNGLVNLTATDSTGKTYKTKADKNGTYMLDLPLGKYTFLYEKSGYETLKVENVNIEEFRNIYIYDAELKFLGPGKSNTVVKDFKDLYKSFTL